MTLAIALNIILATFVVAAIVGGLAWAIVHDRRARLGGISVPRTRPLAPRAELRGAQQRHSRQAWAS